MCAELPPVKSFVCLSAMVRHPKFDRTMPSFAAPAQLLRRLSAAPLPAQIDRETDIQTLETLVLAGQAKASIPARVRTLTGHVRPPATVMEITRMGRTALRYF